MRRIAAPLVGGILAACAGPALAAKNIAACDIVIFASQETGVSIPEQRWRTYREETAASLSAPPAGAAQEALQGVAGRLLAAQEALIGEAVSTDAYRDYLASQSCQILGGLEADAVDGVLSGLDASIPEAAVETARAIASAARAQVTAVNQAARFRSARDRTLYFAAHYCFAAATVHALLSPEQQKSAELATFGRTLSCKDAGRQN